MNEKRSKHSLRAYYFKYMCAGFSVILALMAGLATLSINELLENKVNDNLRNSLRIVSDSLQTDLSSLRAEDADGAAALFQPAAQQDQARLEVVLEVGQVERAVAADLAVGEVRAPGFHVAAHEVIEQPPRHAAWLHEKELA